MSKELGLMLLVFAPALLGLLALLGAFFLFVKKPEEPGPHVARTVAIVLLLFVAFGIGTCYALTMYGGRW